MEQPAAEGTTSAAATTRTRCHGVEFLLLLGRWHRGPCSPCLPCSSRRCLCIHAATLHVPL